MDLPAHKGALYLTHNEHKNVYEKLEKWLEEEEERFDWKDGASRQRAIDTDECWVLQWYPNTPIGFNCVAAPTLEELLALAANPPD